MRNLISKVRRSRAAETVRSVRSVILRATTKPASIGRRKVGVEPRFYSDRGRPTFFGYHDKTPLDLDGNKMLAMSISASDANPESECTEMQIGYFSVEDNAPPSFETIAATTTWSWQQGCMLQWNPANPRNEIIFNTMIEGSYGSVVFDCATRRATRELPTPIYAVDGTGRVASTLNFARLNRLRPGYGYRTPDSTWQELAPERDGIFLLDLHSGEKTLLISLASLAAMARAENGFEHYVNHATFSPDSRYLVFFHLMTRAAVNRMRVCAIELATGRCFDVEAERIVSHYCWRMNGELVATTRDSSGTWRYTLYRMGEGRTDLRLPLDTDGHPMFHPTDIDLLITDTYPDRRRDQHLCVVNIRTGSVEEVATLYSPLAYRGQVRCDLHPRWDRAGRRVVVDTTARGKREMAVVQVGNLDSGSSTWRA